MIEEFGESELIVTIIFCLALLDNFDTLHGQEKMTRYRHALLAHKIFNDTSYLLDSIKLQPEYIRNLKFITIDNDRFKIGQNKACNKIKIINNQINLIDLND